jgi:RimJ/RimL family protein N-acetyltransferase
VEVDPGTPSLREVVRDDVRAQFPTPQPSLDTARLVLRPFTPADAPHIHRYVSDRDVAAMTLNIPHPYPDDGAERWIESQAGKYADGKMAAFAIVERDSGALVGSVGLTLDQALSLEKRRGRAERRPPPHRSPAGNAVPAKP